MTENPEKTILPTEEVFSEAMISLPFRTINLRATFRVSMHLRKDLSNLSIVLVNGLGPRFRIQLTLLSMAMQKMSSRSLRICKMSKDQPKINQKMTQSDLELKYHTLKFVELTFHGKIV